MGSPDPIKTRAMWAELHLRAIASETPNLAAEKAWLYGWLGGLGCGSCHADSQAWVAQNPPDCSSAAAYFSWSVKFHSYVSVKIGKPIWTVAEAMAYWQNHKPEIPQMPSIIPAKEVPMPSGPQWIAWGIDGLGAGVENGRASETIALIIGSGQGDTAMARMVKPMERVKLVSPEPTLAANATDQQKLDASEAAKFRDGLDALIATFAKNTGRSAQ